MRSCKSARPWRFVAVVGCWLVTCAPARGAEARSEAGAGGPSPCSTVGAWVDPGTGARLAHDAVIAEHAARAVVLLGESHHDRRHHLWQLHTLAALHGRRPDMVLGFEMFPRSAQPVLDRWVAGELTAEAFLRAVNWAETWGFDADLYMPLFEFARQNRVPMVALNVDRALIARVGREGWDGVPVHERSGVSDPSPPDEAYRLSLAQVYATKRSHARGTIDEPGAEPGGSVDALSHVLGDPGFQRFVEAQLTWDRAMAEALAAARRSAGGPLMVGIVGSGHAEHRWGIPRQLADLGVADTGVLLPIDQREHCGGVPFDVADAVFVLERTEEPNRARPRLGVQIETTRAGVRIDEVVQDSVADEAGMMAGDIVVAAAGSPVNLTDHLIEIVARQAPGTWLPVTIRRDGKTLELIARFPAAGETDR